MPSVAEQLRLAFARPIAHRGLHGCGSGHPVENTIAAAEAAIAAGYGIECDVQLTRDGEAIVFHDETFDRLLGRKGDVASLDAAEIAGMTLSDGSPIPTLRWFLSAIAGRVPVIVEIKSRDDGETRLAERVCQDIAGYPGVVALKSFDPTIVEHCREAACPIGLIGPSHRGSGAERTPSRCDFLSWNIAHLHDLTADATELPVMTWVVTGKEQASHCLQQTRAQQIVFEGFLP